MELLVLVFQACYSFGVVFMICELCQRMANEFDEFDEVVIQFDWYLYPHKLQQMLSILIVFIQQETAVECFGRISCNREAFKQVSRMASQSSEIILEFGSSMH